MLSPLRARKSDNYRDNFEREPSKKKQGLIPKMMQKGLRVVTLLRAIEKSPILNEYFDGSIIISSFDGSNNIFVDCNRKAQPPICIPNLYKRKTYQY